MGAQLGSGVASFLTVEVAFTLTVVVGLVDVVEVGALARRADVVVALVVLAVTAASVKLAAAKSANSKTLTAVILPNSEAAQGPQLGSRSPRPRSSVVV